MGLVSFLGPQTFFWGNRIELVGDFFFKIGNLNAGFGKKMGPHENKI